MIDSKNKKTRMDIAITMNAIRIVACISIVETHILDFLYFRLNNNTDGLLSKGVNFLMTLFSGEVFVFFILSGFGLSFSYCKNGSSNLIKKFFYRFSRIVIPYWIVTSVFYLLLRILNNLYSHINFKYSFYDLTMYLLLLRNFTRESWYMFEHLWFIPVIISYYLIFPLLIKILLKIGRFRFLCLSLFVTYCTFGILISTGHKIMRQSSNFLYYLPMFSLGMVLGHILFHEAELFKKLLKIHAIYSGIACLIISALMRRSIIFRNVNDMFTGTGLFLIMAFIIYWIMPYIPKKGIYIINNIYKYTYLTYLIHFPLIRYILYPLFSKYDIRLNFVFLLIPGLLFSIVLLFISKAILNYKKIRLSP